MTHHAGVARCKGHCVRDMARTMVHQEHQKRWTFRRRRRAHLECNKGIRNWHFNEQLHLGSKRISGGIYTKALMLEIVKQAVGISSRLQKVRDWTLWRGQPILKRKMRLHTE
jgi:hypothetical protein